MVQDFLTTVFNPNQFTGSEHVYITALLSVLGVISGVVWICIGMSMVIRHLIILALRTSAHGHQPAGLGEKKR